MTEGDLGHLMALVRATISTEYHPMFVRFFNIVNEPDRLGTNRREAISMCCGAIVDGIRQTEPEED